MERIVGVEEARKRLGQLVEEVTAGGEPIILSKRGAAVGVLISREEYSRMKKASTSLARRELLERLAQARDTIQAEGLDPSVVDEAIAAARKA